MSNAGKAIANLSSNPATGYAILGVVAIVGFVIVSSAIKKLGASLGEGADKAAKAAGVAGQAVVDTASGIATGNLATAHGTPYEGTGIIGTLGLATDKLFGGGLSEFGGWIGDTVYDFSHPENDPNGSNGGGSLGMQSWSGNPYGGGPTSFYQDAAGTSPTAAQYAATPGAASSPQGADIAPNFGLYDPSTWD